MAFFKMNDMIMANFIHACISIGTLPDDNPGSIIFEDVMGIFTSTSTLVVDQIGCQVPNLKAISLGYLETILRSYADEKKDFKQHLVALTILVDRVIDNTTDKGILKQAIDLCELFKSTIQDEFLLQQLDEYLDENLYDKYYEQEVGRFKVSDDLTKSRLHSVEKWKMLRSLSLRSPFKKPPDTIKNIKEEDSDSKSNFSPLNSQYLLGKSVIEINIEEVICDGTLNLIRQSPNSARHP